MLVAALHTISTCSATDCFVSRSLPGHLVRVRMRGLGSGWGVGMGLGKESGVSLGSGQG